MVIQKMLMTASLGGLLSLGAPGMSLGLQGTTGQDQPKAQPEKRSQPGQQTQQATKSISGKVTDIGDQGHSFTLETDNGGSKQTMKFRHSAYRSVDSQSHPTIRR
jgi:hypothetical protein